jgi:uncharacterized SAM-binding protein YcdF (DUF218 family)
VRSRIWRVGIAAGVVAGFFLFLFFTHERWLRASAWFLVEAEDPMAADFVLVLAGDYTGNRLMHGAELVRNGMAAKAIISGPLGFYGGYESDYAVAYAAARGYAADLFIKAPHKAVSTEEEAAILVPFLRRLHAGSVMLVTSDFHTRRAGKLFRRAGPDIRWRVVAAPTRRFHPDHWWRDREGRKTFAYEWIKTATSVFGL